MAGSFAGVLIALVDILPIDDVEEGLDVIGTKVLVLQVVGMFPDIKAKEGNQTMGDLEWVLVLAGGNLQLVVLAAVTQPAPT